MIVVPEKSRIQYGSNYSFRLLDGFFRKETRVMFRKIAVGAKVLLVAVGIQSVQ